MKAIRKRKCRHCGELFHTDPRNKRHQHYCGKMECIQASKAASQRRWLSKPENRDYFKGPENVERVRRWRKSHPGYWRKKNRGSQNALQDVITAQPTETNQESGISANSPLQDVLLEQPLVLIGLIAQMTGATLQDEIASTSRNLIRLGQDILGWVPKEAHENAKTNSLPRPGAASAKTVQLGRPTACA